MSLKIKNAFNQIQTNHEMKLQTKQYLLQKTNMPETKKINKKKYLIAFSTSMTACIVLSCSYLIPVTAISIDVNPSIQLELNLFDRVIAAYGYNEGGTYVVENNDIKHLNYIDALNYLVESESMQNYVEEDAIMEIMVVTNSDHKKQTMEVAVTNAHALSNINTTCHTADSQLKQQANKVGLSCGKFNAYLKVKEIDPSVTPEDINQLSMAQIREILKLPLEENCIEKHEHYKGKRHCNKE